MGLKAGQKVRQVRHYSSANFELKNVGRTFELKPEPATPMFSTFSKVFSEVIFDGRDTREISAVGSAN